MALNDKYVNRNSDVAGIENLRKFDVFLQNHRYIDPFTTGYAFVFVTKPSLFLNPYKPAPIASDLDKIAYENMTRDQFFAQFLVEEAMNKNDETIIKQLSFKNDLSLEIPNFIPLFTNKLRSLQTMDITLNQTESFETRQGFRMPLPTHRNESISSNSLSLSCIETLNLDFIKITGLWVNYIANVTDGTFHANPVMIKNNVIDYMSSIYYFLLEPDGRTLKYWTKYTGCWPTSIPQSALGFSRGEQSIVEVDVNFAYTSKEDMNPAILEDFNRISLNYFEQDYSTLNVEEDAYASVKRSRLLSIASLKNNPNFLKETRGPLIFYRDGKAEQSSNPDTMIDKFELSFGEDSYKNTFTEGILGKNYYLDKQQKDFFSSKLDEE
jgi:hypothetical protein